MTSRCPAVVSIPTFAPLRSRRALVATVVPCTMRPVSASSPARSVPSSAASRPRPSITPMDGSAGVEADLARLTPPASSTPTRSVKVPPTSTPTRSNSDPPASWLRGDEAVDAVGGARLGRAARRRAVAAAAHGLDQEDGARRDRDAHLLRLQHARLAPREHAVAMGKAVLAAQHPVGRIADPVARGIAERGLGRLHAHLEHRSHAAAVAPVARRVRPELVALEEEREARLRNLDAAELDPARRLALARGLPAVARGGCAAAAPPVEELPDELALVPGIRARDRDAEATRPAREYPVRAALGQRLDHGLRDLLRAVVG